MIRIHYLYKNNPKFANKEIRGLQTQKRHQIFLSNAFLLVIRLGLEPKTPTLKVLCSTCWASESNLMFFLSKVLRYGRDSNPRPPAWQAGILTNWTTTPLFDCFRSRLRVQRYDLFLNLQAFWRKKSKFLVFSLQKRKSKRCKTAL